MPTVELVRRIVHPYRDIGGESSSLPSTRTPVPSLAVRQWAGVPRLSGSTCSSTSTRMLTYSRSSVWSARYPSSWGVDDDVSPRCRGGRRSPRRDRDAAAARRTHTRHNLALYDYGLQSDGFAPGICALGAEAARSKSSLLNGAETSKRASPAPSRSWND